MNIKDTDRVADFRRRVEEMYGINANSFMITQVYDNKLVTIYHN
jgi:hypothetical protein